MDARLSSSRGAGSGWKTGQLKLTSKPNDSVEENYYRKITVSVPQLLECKTFNPNIWKQWLEEYTYKNDKDSIRYLRMLIAEQVHETCKNLGYKALHDHSFVSLWSSQEEREAQITSSIFYSYEKLQTISLQAFLQSQSQLHSPPFPNTKVIVVALDCLETAIALQKYNEHFSIAVLNMASSSSPGGGYKRGAGAQEENIFRRSSYFLSLADTENFSPHIKRNWTYPLPEFGGIFSPNVKVFRSSEDYGYAYMKSPATFSFLAVAAYSRPQITYPTTKRKAVEGKLTARFAEQTKQKIRSMFNILIENKIDCIILSAFGCGAFGNPPNHMAELFKEVIEEYNGYFKYIIFAIVEDQNSRRAHNPNGNFRPFCEVFQHDLKKFVHVVSRKPKYDVQDCEEDPEDDAENDLGLKDILAELKNSDCINNGFGLSEQFLIDKVRELHQKLYISEPSTVTHFSTPSDTKFGFLSNWAITPFADEGIVYESVEHYYQLKKAHYAGCDDEFLATIIHADTPKDAFNLGKQVEDNDIWEQKKLHVLYYALVTKFKQNPKAAAVLKDTGSSYIIFECGDPFLGRKNSGHGSNHLGILLMKVRDVCCNSPNL